MPPLEPEHATLSDRDGRNVMVRTSAILILSLLSIGEMLQHHVQEADDVIIRSAAGRFKGLQQGRKVRLSGKKRQKRVIR